MPQFAWVLLGMALFGMNSAQAESTDPNAAELQLYLEQLNGVSTTFSQQVVDARGQVIEQSQGRLQLAKPNFRWDVADPFPQTILARGNTLEIYDPDLEQVVVRDLTAAVLQDMPLALLTGRTVDLDATYRVEKQKDSAVLSEGVAQQHTYRLYPRSEESLFEYMDLTFFGASLVRLFIQDQTGTRSTIDLQSYQAGQPLAPEAFELELPPGTEVVKG